MTEIKLPDYLPAWMSEHVNLYLYLADGEAGHLWDASLGGGLVDAGGSGEHVGVVFERPVDGGRKWYGLEVLPPPLG